MRFPDPFTNPDLCPGFVTADLIDYDPRIRDELPNGRVLEVKSSAQYWGISITLPDLFDKEFRFLDSVICEYKRTGAFLQILLPQYENFHVTSGENTTSIAQGQKGSQVKITNLGSLIGRPVSGDLFQLSTHPKVYKITNVQESGGVLTLSLYPDLFATTSNNSKPIFNGILFQTKLSSGDSMTQSINSDGMYEGVAFKFREAL